jgi:hypothetical protein
MQDPNQSDLPPEAPICVCGYSMVGLPETDHPCPECGSTKLAVYQSSFSYYGWILGGLGTWISFVHSVVGAGLLLNNLLPMSTLFYGLWMFICVPLGILSLICTAISMVKREPRRKSVRDIGFALVSGLLFPVALFIALMIDVLVFGGMWTV